ncbi:MAG: thiamine pyrophosphate-binding protein [Candidatus Riflebacteria bacterium]|nr:thiamine pyrophosphate-binding protein [Candidatus Riflebacteria bacterium]
MKIRVADFIVRFLRDTARVRHVFLVSGGGIMFLTDALAQCPEVKAVCTHHEQSAAMALEAYARTTGGVGAGFFTTGPGATNAITGLVGAWLDSVPCLFVSGQAKRRETVRLAGIPGLRQFGVQEVDILPVVQSLTKYAVMLDDPAEVRYELEKAFHLATTGRPGPVWIDVPLDVQGALVDPRRLRGFPAVERPALKTRPVAAEMRKFQDLLRQAERPVILAGQGVAIARAGPDLERFADAHGIPVVHSFLGANAIGHRHRCRIGPVGIKGSRAGNLAVQNADLVIAIGTSLHVGTIGYEYGQFAREAVKVVVDIDRTAHRKKTIAIDLYINADAREFLRQANAGAVTKARPSGWLRTCRRWLRQYPVCLPDYAQEDRNGINLYQFIDRLSACIRPDDVVVSDAGSVYYAVAQGLRQGILLTSGGIATMGYSLPAAIGAAEARNGRVVAITGDGSLQMNVQELQTVVHHRLPVKLFVISNQGYLSIRFTQDRFFAGRRLGEGAASGVSLPHLGRLARAYGLDYCAVRRHRDLDRTIRKVLATPGPVVCEVFGSPDQAIVPTVSSVKLEDGSMVSKPLEDMFPFLDREEFRQNMIVKPLKGC